jgi:2,5-dioxopentanoate dehydrogenase
MTSLHGKQFIGFTLVGKGKDSYQTINPITGDKMLPHFREASKGEVLKAIEKANHAFNIYRQKSGIEKAEFLEAIAEEIEALGGELIQRCVSETALPEARIQGERGRTIGQIMLFAQMLREGSWVQAHIDTAQPERKPLPKPDIRSMQMAIGPVVVFGASNFPLAFSVAGGDTISALAAGCPVVVKAHPAHAGTCELIASAITQAAIKKNMPDGVFSMLHGGAKIGAALVKHPNIKAVGFTGSFKVGKTLFDIAAKRPQPIPVYAEMGSVNPVFVLPNALEQDTIAISQGFTNSVNLGVGQFCTNPGMMVIENTPSVTAFVDALKQTFSQSNGGTMLTQSMQKAYENGIKHIKLTDAVSVLAEGTPLSTHSGVTPALFETTVKNIHKKPVLMEEVFGPTSLVVKANDKNELLKMAQSLEGHLTATVFATANDLANYRELIDILTQKVGRLIINGYPTGVEVCHSMVHGGPYPATTYPNSTSVGTNAVYRFTRAVCFQGFPDTLLPDELKETNPLSIFRKNNGLYQS